MVLYPNRLLTKAHSYHISRLHLYSNVTIPNFIVSVGFCVFATINYSNDIQQLKKTLFCIPLIRGFSFIFFLLNHFPCRSDTVYNVLPETSYIMWLWEFFKNGFEYIEGCGDESLHRSLFHAISAELLKSFQWFHSNINGELYVRAYICHVYVFQKLHIIEWIWFLEACNGKIILHWY